MDEEKLIEVLKNVLNTDCGFAFVTELLEKLGAFERGCNFDNVNMEYYNRGRREKGLWLLDLVKKADLKISNKIETKRR